MTIRHVPTDFASITLAVAGSNPGDTILVDLGYAGNELVLVTVNNLTVSAPAAVSNISLILQSSIVKITLAGDSDISVTGNDLGNSIYGNAGNNNLDGRAGQDHYYSSAGNDTYGGGGGIDQDIVDYSLDKAQGATHGIIVNQSARIIQEVGLDTVIDGFGNTDSIVDIRNIIGSSFADRIYGGSKANTLSGGGGKDMILGGTGADILTGGTGADTFVYKALSESTVLMTNPKDGRDTITDFKGSEFDKINLHKIDANSGVAGNQDFSFIGATGFSNHAGELKYNVVADGVVVVGDVNGDAVADFAIHLTGISSLAAGDFIL